jgi:hypothetical protein
MYRLSINFFYKINIYIHNDIVIYMEIKNLQSDTEDKNFLIDLKIIDLQYKIKIEEHTIKIKYSKDINTSRYHWGLERIEKYKKQIIDLQHEK